MMHKSSLSKLKLSDCFDFCSLSYRTAFVAQQNPFYSKIAYNNAL